MSDNNRNIKIYIRVTEDERKLISKLASDDNMSRSAYILQCVKQNKKINLNGIKDVVHQLYKIGANINQIASKANSITYISKDEVKKTQELLISIFRIIDKFIVENNKHINEELQSNLTTDQKFELLITKINSLENDVGEICGILQNCSESNKE